MKTNLTDSLKRAGAVLEKKTMRDFAHKFGLVYFGSVNDQRDSYGMVRGITLQTNHHDRHFMVGNYRGRDVTALQRTVTLNHPSHEATKYKWLLVQADLQRRRLPHILVTVGHHDRLFFDNLQIKLASFQQLNEQLIPNANFAHHFRVLAETSGLDQVPSVLTPEIMAAMAQYFKGFDVELFDDQIIVYTRQQRLTTLVMQELLREALWLAEQLDVPFETGPEIIS